MEDKDAYSIIRKEIRFTGAVQGVGFRYRAKYAASGCGVTGWVKNEWDGSVLMEAQGTNRQINEMLKMINASSYIIPYGIFTYIYLFFFFRFFQFHY